MLMGVIQFLYKTGILWQYAWVLLILESVTTKCENGESGGFLVQEFINNQV